MIRFCGRDFESVTIFMKEKRPFTKSNGAVFYKGDWNVTIENGLLTLSNEWNNDLYHMSEVVSLMFHKDADL